jgi:nucleoside-diphosphate-sugar epimerase
MNAAAPDDLLIGTDEAILVTGATGFIGSRLVKALLDRGFRNVRCFARPTSDRAQLDAACGTDARLEVITGNRPDDCLAA